MRKSWQLWTSAVDPDQCDFIIEKYINEPEIQGTVKSGESNQIRQSKIRWIDDRGIRDNLWHFAKTANSESFGFNVQDVSNIQLTEYRAEYGGKYDWHMDVNWENDPNPFDRKISLVMQLSDPSTYEGGNLEFLGSEVPQDQLRQKGTVICFPSFMWHRVTPLTKGTRFSLVAWFEGVSWQ